MYSNSWWHTPYGSHNHTRDFRGGMSLTLSHGFIAIDRKEAEAMHWPITMWLPSDHDKGVYLLEAYHQMHCLV